ncbi:MAG: hypothetical protein MUP22_02070 [Desulfobacterales bacterium]|nr:hypothetical protein [Desulfobacterales bacterium]
MSYLDMTANGLGVASGLLLAKTRFSGALLFISITFSPLLVYPLAYFRGASLTERMTASLIIPFLWATKECFRLLTSFTFLESLYYYFNPLSLWLFCGVFAQMGLLEMICRKKLKNRGEKIKAMHPVALAVFFISLFLVVFLYAWGQGENIYVIFLVWFRKFFGPGVGIQPTI